MGRERLGTPELDNGKLDKQKCTQNIGILPGLKKNNDLSKLTN